MKNIVLLPFSLILLTSCSAVDNYKGELKEELKTELKSEITASLKEELKSELKSEITASLKEELDKNNNYEIKLIDDTLLGVSNFKTEKLSYGGCTVSGNFKFNIKVPDNFTGDISDIETTYLIKGKEKIDSYYESFIDGKSINGTNIYEYESEELSPSGILICSIKSSDDIKIKSFSEKIMIFPAIKPLVK